MNSNLQTLYFINAAVRTRIFFYYAEYYPLFRCIHFQFKLQITLVLGSVGDAQCLERGCQTYGLQPTSGQGGTFILMSTPITCKDRQGAYHYVKEGGGGEGGGRRFKT